LTILTTHKVQLHQGNAGPINIKGNFISNNISLYMYIRNLSHYILTGLLPWIRFLANSPFVRRCLSLRTDIPYARCKHNISMKNPDFMYLLRDIIQYYLGQVVLYCTFCVCACFIDCGYNSQYINEQQYTNFPHILYTLALLR
jgi:hypothetical protein